MLHHCYQPTNQPATQTLSTSRVQLKIKFEAQKQKKNKTNKKKSGKQTKWNIMKMNFMAVVERVVNK